MSTRIERVVEKGRQQDPEFAGEDLRYWLAQPIEARLSCVEVLRRQAYGVPPGLPRLARVVEKVRR